MPLRQHYLFVCTNCRPDVDARGCCGAKGAEEIRQALKEGLATRGLARVVARACSSGCLDQCASGVTILIEPDHFFYGRVTIRDVPEIIESLVHGKRIERLVLAENDLA